MVQWTERSLANGKIRKKYLLGLGAGAPKYLLRLTQLCGFLHPRRDRRVIGVFLPEREITHIDVGIELPS